MKHEELSEKIIGAAMAVLNELKPGLDEKPYENALVLELRAQGHQVEQQRQYPVHYRGQLIGTLIPDLIVDGKVIVDPKVVTDFNIDTAIRENREPRGLHERRRWREVWADKIGSPARCAGAWSQVVGCSCIWRISRFQLLFQVQ